MLTFGFELRKTVFTYFGTENTVLPLLVLAFCFHLASISSPAMQLRRVRGICAAGAPQAAALRDHCCAHASPSLHAFHTAAAEFPRAVLVGTQPTYRPLRMGNVEGVTWI